MVWIGALQRVQGFPSSASCAAIAGTAALAVLAAGSQLQAVNPQIAFAVPFCFAGSAFSFRNAAQYLQQAHGINHYGREWQVENSVPRMQFVNAVLGMVGGALAMLGAFTVPFHPLPIG